MRILHVINGLSAIQGGPTATVAAQANAQVKNGDDVVVLSVRRTSPPLTLPLGVHGRLAVHELPIDGEVKWYHSSMLSEMRRYVRACDVVHIHGSWRYHLVAAAQAAREQDVPYVISPDGNLDRYSLSNKWLFKRLYFSLIERRIMDRAAGIHCCSQMELDEVSLQGIAARKFVVPNPVDPALLAEAPDDSGLTALIPQLDAQQKVILSLNRIHPIKGLDVVINAFALVASEFPDWIVVLAGPPDDRSYEERVREQIRRLHLEKRVVMPGMVRGGVKAALLRRASIYVQASAHENFCVSLAEAFMFGIPCVVAPGVALARDAAQHQAGIVASDTEPEQFAAGLRRLMLDANLRKSFGDNGRLVAKQFFPDAVKRRFAEEYGICMGQSKGFAET